MELTELELQIVNELKQVEILTNKQIAAKLNKDPGNISRKMKQLVEKQVVKKKRKSDGKITCNYYSLNNDIENLQQVVQGETSCKKEVSISSEDIYDADNINVRESFIPEQKRDTLGVSEYHPRQVVQSEKTQMALDVDRTIIHVLKYLSFVSKSRLLTSKEQRLVRILSENTKNYTWIYDCISLFLSIAMRCSE